MCNKIHNPHNAKIETKEIYQGIFEHIVEEGYYFESAYCNYGPRIYTGKIPSNYYIVKKKEDDEKAI